MNKVALVCDWLNQFGGAERVLGELHGLFPSAPIYTAVYEPSRVPECMRDWDVRASFLQQFPFARRRHQPFFPLMPAAFARFDLSEYDLVVSASHAWAKGVNTGGGTHHICYCYTPCRYLWDLREEYLGEGALAALSAPLVERMREWDRENSHHVDRFIAISRVVADRIRRHYGRSAEVIYPPVDVERLRPSGRPPEDFFLIVSRLVPYKRFDLAVRAANRLRLPLKIVGDGPARRRLERIAGPTVEFLGRQPDPVISALYADCRAVLFPGHEDFGIVPVEAQAAGRPVIAFGAGGATETVVDEITGLFFEEQKVESLIDAIERFGRSSFDPHSCRRNAMRFERREFCQRLQAAIYRETERPSVSAPAPKRRVAARA